MTLLNPVVQPLRVSDLRGRLCFSGLSSEVQPLPSERAGPELQPSRRQRSKAPVCSTGGAALLTHHSQVRTAANVIRNIPDVNVCQSEHLIENSV